MKVLCKKVVFQMVMLINFTIIMLVFGGCTNSETTTQGEAAKGIPEVEESHQEEKVTNSYEEVLDVFKEVLPLEINIPEHYITNIGDPSNLYYIDENNVLWGCGQNQYGQLGQGEKDAEFHEEMVKIAENVIHVDYSQKGFVIYITEDKKLYGFGNGASGILYQFASYSSDVFYSYDEYAVSTPMLLMEDVVYARCGRSDVAVLKEDNSVWAWGLIWCRNAQNFYYREMATKVLDNAVFVTGSDYNHAALLQDGSVWTWGYNYSGNCGVEVMPEISVPQKVAEDAIMVWTGNIDGNVDCKNISDFDGEYPHDMENTIIQKNDGSYWICGANVGDAKHTIPHYFDSMDFEMTCSYQFVPYEMSISSDENHGENQEEDSVKVYEPEAYGTIRESKKKFFDEESQELIYYYEIEEFYFDKDYPNADVLNNTLKDIYAAYAPKYEERGKSADVSIEENIPPSWDSWHLIWIPYLGEDYVSIQYNDITYMGGVHPYSLYDGITIDSKTGKEVFASELLGKSDEELLDEICSTMGMDVIATWDDIDFYITEDEIVFFYRRPNYWEDVIMKRVK